MACKLLDREQVPPPPHRTFNGVVDDGDQRWRYKQGLLVAYIRYVPKKQQREGQLPWAELWTPEDGRR